MKVGLSACSDGQSLAQKPENIQLQKILSAMGVESVAAAHIYSRKDAFSGTDEERAEDLMEFYRDDSIDAIYDISGGNLANGVLKYLDWDLIAGTGKSFWGYSDLTTILNAVYTKTAKESILYRIKNVVHAGAVVQRRRFEEYISGENTSLFDLQYAFLQGQCMAGVVVGGNLRCFLKLAGTEYWPDMEGKILLLEAYGGETGAVATALNQLELIGVFKQIAGVLLGTFTKYEKAGLDMSVFELLKMHIPKEMPVAVTAEIGHGADSKAIVIGRCMEFSDGSCDGFKS